MSCNQNESRMFNPVLISALLILALTPLVPSAQAQMTTSNPAEAESDARPYQTFYLNSSARGGDAREVVTDLRNMLPKAKVYYIQSQNAISMIGTPEEFNLARKILSDIDKASKTYRLTYTIVESGGAQQTGSRRIALIVSSGGQAVLKQGSRLPVVTGIASGASSNQNEQVQYQDLGLRIEASLDGPPDGLKLRTRVEQSSVADEKSGLGAQDPVIRETVLDEFSPLVQGRPIVLGSFDVPNSTRREELQVTSELVQ